jgi:hypothetical protein
MKSVEKTPSPCGAFIALFFSGLGALCLFVAVMMTFHAVDTGGRLNQALSLTLRWFEQITETEHQTPLQEEEDSRSSASSENETE